MLSQRREAYRKKQEEFFRQFDDERGLNSRVNGKLLSIAPIILIADVIIWCVWLNKCFTDMLKWAFVFYVIFPFALQLAIVGLLELSRRLLDVEHHPDSKVRESISHFVGAILYTLFFSSYFSIYRPAGVCVLFALCPLILTALYKEFKWTIETMIVTAVAIFAVVMDYFPTTLFRFEAPKGMLAFETIFTSAFIGELIQALHIRTTLVINEVAKAEAIQQAKDTFFAKISHEIRTPINAVLGMDEMILREDITPEVEKYAINIKNAGQTLLSLINDILDSSKLEAGKVEIVPIDYNLTTLISDSYNMVRFRAEEKELKVNVINDHSVPVNLHGDEVRVRQILLNLLTNAIKYTNEGRIDISVNWKGLTDNHIMLILSVKDTGIGISEREIPRLYDSFERLDERNNRYVEGTGLGLNITKHLVDLMNGRIEVKSTVGEGSEFTVYIPQDIVGPEVMGDFYETVENRSKEREKYKEKFVAPDARVLVVDDVQMNIEVFKGLLKKTQIQIDSALSGERALQLLQKKKYDIIFMDHLMPEMDGVETFSRMRNTDTPNNETPVVVLTANAGENAAEEYRNLGFEDYMSKPVKGKALEDMVYKYIRKEEETVLVLTSNENETEEDFLNKLSFLDTESALEYVGNDVSIYKEVLNSYRKDSRLLLLSKNFQEKDWDNYKINAHALKSTSLSIGASDLSEEAKEMEFAAKNGDYDLIFEKHPDMMHHYEQLLGKLNAVLS